MNGTEQENGCNFAICDLRGTHRVRVMPSGWNTVAAMCCAKDRPVTR